MFDRNLRRQSGEVHRALEFLKHNLGRRNANRIYRQSLRSIFSEILQEIRQRTPRNTGYLLRRVDARPGKKGRLDYHIRVGYFRVRRAQQFLGIEYGNRNIAAFRPLRTAWQNNVEKIDRTIGMKLSEELLKTQTKLQRRLEKIHGKTT